MIVLCPHCGKPVVVNGLGRKPFNMPVTEVYDALRLHRSVLAAANSLGCSRAYIYKVLKAGGMTGKDAINRDYTLDKGITDSYNHSTNTKLEELKKRLDEHYRREVDLMEAVLSLSEKDSKEIYEFIVNNRWIKAIKEVKEHVKGGDSKAEGAI